MPVIAPPRKATLSAGWTPLRAASATRAFERTETFMPMYPVEPERMPPIRKPQATAMFWMKIRATKSTTPTAAIVAYWRFRYA